MDLNLIENRLKKLGYHAYFSSTDLIIGKEVGNDPVIPNSKILKNFCVIYDQTDKVLVSYGQSNLSEEKEFSNEERVINFVKSEFPI